MPRKQIPFKAFKRMCVTNSSKLHKVIIKGQMYDWVGIGLVPLGMKATEADYERYPEIVD